MTKRKATYRMPLTELRAYRLIRRRLEIVVRSFHANHGGDLEDMEGDATLKFLELYRSGKYDRSRGSFEYFVEYHVRKMLLESLRTRLGRNNRLPRVEEDLDKHHTQEESMFAVELACADPDIQVVVGIVMATPRLATKKVAGDYQQYIEGFIQRQLPDWRPSRIRNSIRTIRRML